MLLRLSHKYAIPGEFQLGTTTIENGNYFNLAVTLIHSVEFELHHEWQGGVEKGGTKST